MGGKPRILGVPAEIGLRKAHREEVKMAELPKESAATEERHQYSDEVSTQEMFENATK